MFKKLVLGIAVVAGLLTLAAFVVNYWLSLPSLHSGVIPQMADPFEEWGQEWKDAESVFDTSAVQISAYEEQNGLTTLYVSIISEEYIPIQRFANRTMPIGATVRVKVHPDADWVEGTVYEVPARNSAEGNSSTVDAAVIQLPFRAVFQQPVLMEIEFRGETLFKGLASLWIQYDVDPCEYEQYLQHTPVYPLCREEDGGL